MSSPHFGAGCSHGRWTLATRDSAQHGRMKAATRTWTAAQFTHRARLIALLTIVLLCLIWGSTFPMTKGLLERVPAAEYLGLRFSIAFLVGALVFARRLLAMSGRQWFYGLSLGFIFTVGQTFSTVGLQYVDASVSGFITVMYVVFTPMLVWLLFRVKVDVFDWVAVALSITGVGILSLSGGSFSFGLGEGLTLASALAFGMHIVMLSRWATRADPISLSIVQMGVVGITFMLISAPGGITLPSVWTDWTSIIYMAVIAGLIAMSMQAWAQQLLSATTVALMFSLEPVFASVLAIWVWDEPLTGRLVVGGALILLAMQVSVLGPRYLERRQAVVVKETVLEETSAGFSQAFEDVFEGGLPTAVVQGEDLLESDALAASMEGLDAPEIGRAHV